MCAQLTLQNFKKPRPEFAATANSLWDAKGAQLPLSPPLTGPRSLAARPPSPSPPGSTSTSVHQTALQGRWQQTPGSSSRGDAAAAGASIMLSLAARLTSVSQWLFLSGKCHHHRRRQQPFYAAPLQELSFSR